MTERHLVTGGSGYFGSVLVHALLRRGVRVRVFDLVDAPGRPSQVEFIRGDIRDTDAVQAACADCTVVHHNVALVPLANDAPAFEAVNVQGTRHLLAAAARAGARKVIHTSSSAVFGVPSRNPVDDTVAPRPREAYGRAKLAAELACTDYVRRGLDVTIVRPRTIIGPGRLGIVQVLFEWVRTGRNVPVLAGGRNIYQFVQADDLADACWRAANRPGPAVYNVGASTFGTMRQTLEGLIKHAGTGSRIVSLPMTPVVWGMTAARLLRLSPLAAYHALMYGRSMYFDTSRARNELGWEPRYGNVEMFCESYDWYVQHRTAVAQQGAASYHRTLVRSRMLSVVGVILSQLPASHAGHED